jgi:uncharacterized protein YndB with AHSA1/START domain
MSDNKTVSDQAEAVTRSLDTGNRDGSPTRVATISQRYDTGVEDLWEACSSPERLARWFAPVAGDLALGGRFQIEGNAAGTVEACDPPRSFSTTWEYGGEISWITVEITPDGGGARLSLEHTAPADAMVEFWERYGPGATGVGWDLAFLGLAIHIATGADRPAEDDGFETTDEGQRFFTACSAAWAEASIAAGTPRQDAYAARDRTTAFYLGEPEPPAPQ